MNIIMKFGICAIGALLWSGCFRYVPSDLGAVPPGEEVRLELTRTGFAQLPEIPNRPGPELGGTLVRADASSLTLRVPVAIRRDGLVVGTVEQDVLIPTAEILSLERREFSRRRTGLVGALGAAALVGVLEGFGTGGPPSGEEPDPPIDEEAGSALVASFHLLSAFFR